MKQRIISIVASLVFLIVGTTCFHTAVYAQSKSEVIEWTWEVRPDHADAKLPNVLLEGDSLTRNYFPAVQRLLAGKANIYLMASSICVGDPRLPGEIVMFGKMEDVHFRVVHFNNGMHGWQYTGAQYKADFPVYLAALRSIAPGATFIWATTTPVKVESKERTNVRIDARNAIAQTFVRGMVVDDQHALMEKHQDLYKDDVHFNANGSNISGKQAANLILHALQESVPQKH